MVVAKTKGKKRGRKPKNAVNGENKKIKPPPKKRGRKPKGGKILKNIKDPNKNKIMKKTNIILHLKCSFLNLKKMNIQLRSLNHLLNIQNNKQTLNLTEINKHEEDQNNKKDIWEKITHLKKKMHFNDVSDKDLTVFGAHVHLIIHNLYTKQERNGLMEVYGCFCSPECAVVFKREQLIHQHYGKDILC